MKPFINSLLVILILTGLSGLTSCKSGNQRGNKVDNSDQSKQDVLRFGMVIKLDSAKMNKYIALHADSNFGIRDLLQKYNMRNFSIFMTKLEDGNYYEFGYYEYTGNDLESDMAALAREPRNIEWLKECDPCQIPLKGETTWKKMDRIFYNK
jgi:L-rhamnose mutarotase